MVHNLSNWSLHEFPPPPPMNEFRTPKRPTSASIRINEIAAQLLNHTPSPLRTPTAFFPSPLVLQTPKKGPSLNPASLIFTPYQLDGVPSLESTPSTSHRPDSTYIISKFYDLLKSAKTKGYVLLPDDISNDFLNIAPYIEELNLEEVFDDQAIETDSNQSTLKDFISQLQKIMPNVRSIRLSNYHHLSANIFHFLSDWKNLCSLNLDNSTHLIKDFPTYQSKFDSLECLSLELSRLDAFIIDDNYLAKLTNASCLTYLNLSGSAITDEGLSNCLPYFYQLQFLSLRNCSSITGKITTCLVKSPHLQELDIEGVPLTHHDFITFANVSTELKTIYLTVAFTITQSSITAFRNRNKHTKLTSTNEDVVKLINQMEAVDQKNRQLTPKRLKDLDDI